jgi:hypothetical protein
MPHWIDLQYRDYSDELSSCTFNVSPITVGTITALLAEFASLRSATDAIVLGVRASDTVVMDKTVGSASRPTSAVAQRELKWLVRYHGVDDGKKWTCEIPTPDITLTDVLIPGTDIVDLTQTEMAAFVTAFETAVRPPGNDTSLVVIDQIVLVGRNL